MGGRSLKMNIIQKAVVMVGQVIGALLGQDLDTPVSEVLKKYPDLRYGR
jgi:hypothetical protein